MTGRRQGALAGFGVVALPAYLCREDIDRGALEVVLGDWSPPLGNVHVVFPSRRGLVPAVRCFIDHLAGPLPTTLEQCRAAIARGHGGAEMKSEASPIPEHGGKRRPPYREGGDRKS